ncbi:MAG TPA: AAA family ATPase [Candidatus Paceibacterota bacterium]|nr:AAA family ATPase [Candidatus Paceibacterota bacterium]
MTLKSIVLTGFKSFGKKSVVDFTTPITSIVGPNGSGKSNIVEAIRFVLGEQSMKSLRGKGGVDLIFKGSKALSSSSRAHVQIIFDNTNKIFSFTNSGLGIPLDYDEVIIGREVFSDGSNKYSINNTEVRLKDIVDLLASVNIGSSGHHIISQGEADRVLNASNKERRAMIEDALGLKVYQFRIKESERKLEKTLLNIKEVQALRREIAPHLAFLKKQVGIVEKARTMREELREMYKTYLSKEGTYIKNESKRLSSLSNSLKEKDSSLKSQIEEFQKKKNENQTENIFAKEIKENEIKVSEIRNNKNELVRKLGRIEGIIEGIEQQFFKVKEVKTRIIEESEWKSFVADISKRIDEALLVEDLPSVINALKSIKSRLEELNKNDNTEEKKVSLDDNIEYKEMQNTKNDIVKDIERIEKEENEILNNIRELKQKEQDNLSKYRDSERVLYELLREENEVVSNLHSLSFEEEKLASIKSSFESELTEAGVLIGREIISFAQTETEEEINRSSQEELRRKIERIKIKIEDAGTGSGNDIMKEYEETTERDAFLAKEVEDLNKSIKDCHILIGDLKEKLDTEFKGGIEKINKQFQEFFSLMFGGGGAFLSITMENKKPKKNDESIEDEENEIDESSTEGEESELGFERGIEINVNLPHKKVKDLHMLSGGERSLTSIALLFAISQVNPPPFLVLDETDAALDEANSRKYGDMLENLSKYSQLIVVTHNRETMSRAQVLFGVTMSSDGVSKLLSIHLEDATIYAK